MKKLSGKKDRCFESEENEQPASHLQCYRPAATEEIFHGIRINSVNESCSLDVLSTKTPIPD